MLPITEELSDYHSELANEKSLCSEPNLLLNMLRVNSFHYFFILVSSCLHRKVLFLREP